MSQFGKRSLFSYLLNNVQKENIDNRRDVNVSSPEALAILTALSFDEKPRKMFFLFPTIYEAEEFTQILGDYLSSDDVFMFPYDEILRSSAIGVSPEMGLERCSAIASIMDPRPSILVFLGFVRKADTRKESRRSKRAICLIKNLLSRNFRT